MSANFISFLPITTHISHHNFQTYNYIKHASQFLLTFHYQVGKELSFIASHLCHSQHTRFASFSPNLSLLHKNIVKMLLWIDMTRQIVSYEILFHIFMFQITNIQTSNIHKTGHSNSDLI